MAVTPSRAEHPSRDVIVGEFGYMVTLLIFAALFPASAQENDTCSACDLFSLIFMVFVHISCRVCTGIAAQGLGGCFVLLSFCTTLLADIFLTPTPCNTPVRHP